MKNFCAALFALLISFSVFAATAESGPPKVVITPSAAGAGNTGELKFKELKANGEHHVGFKAPDSITANKVWTLPSADGSANQALVTNGSGLLQWLTVSPAFNNITTGTNTTATMTVGTGATLTTSGSGTIAATTATTATNLVGSGSTTNAVDLATAEVSGDLPFANLAQGTARSVLGVTGNAGADVASIQGTADQVLRVNAAGNALEFGTVAANGLASDSVTTAKILNANVTAVKMVNSGVFTGDVTTTFPAITIGNNAITTVKILDANVTTAKIADANVTLAKLESRARPTDNLLINGGMDFIQRMDPTAFKPDSPASEGLDDEYGPDRWYCLEDHTVSSAHLRVKRVDAAAEGAKYAAEFQPGASTRWGILQVVESFRSIPMRGRTVRFQARVKRASTSANWRAAILEWTGTADTSIAKSIVANADFANGTFTEGNFFTTHASYEVNTVGSAVSVDTNYTTVSVTATISANCNNIMVFLWQDASSSVNTFITEAGLYDGVDAREWLPRTNQEELALCQRYCHAIETDATQTSTTVGMGRCYSTNNMTIMVFLPQTMRVVPSMTATGSDWNGTDSVDADFITAISLDTAFGSTRSVNVLATGTSSLWDVGKAAQLYGDGTAGRRMIFDAEL